MSPSLNKAIAMAYIDKGRGTKGEPLFALVRAKKIQIKLAKMPFLPSNYYK
jgi:aminomethyltransferase